MKYLSEYMEKRQNKAFDKAGSFFAFGKEQYEKKQVANVKYVNLGGGLICPVDNSVSLNLELKTIYEECIQEDIKDNGLEAIILRELNNHEAYYTQEIDDTVDALADYPVTADDISKMLHNKNYKVTTCL